jgi:hypothetical protein
MAYYISNEGKETSSVFDITINVKTGGYLMTNTKTYDVPFQGRVDYTVRVEASDPSEALEKARELRDEINLKSEIYVNGWFNDEWTDEVEEIDVVAEEA